MTSKRITAALLTIAVFITFIPGFAMTVSAANRTMPMSIINRVAVDNDALAVEPSDVTGEEVTFIVEVEGDPLAVEYEAGAVSDTEKAEELLSQQTKVMSLIQDKIDQSARKGFVYTAVFNGFSVEGTMDQLNEIKALDGVKNVYVSSEMKIIEPVDETETTPMISSAGELSGVDEAHDLGYTGEGTVVAVIDLGCDTSHDFFKKAPNNPRYSIDDIDGMVKELPLNADVASGNQVYKNEKIPYAYNYTEKNADTYIHSEAHGTHVAGIVAGKDGVAPDGSLFSGIAPDAQLLFMSCGTTDGMISTDAALAALNDAVLLGADAVNMSFGSDYVDVMYNDIYRKAIEGCRAAGVSVITANGNASRGYNDMVPSVERPDYGTIGIPNGESSATAVGSVNNSSLWYEYIELEAPDNSTYEVYISKEDDDIKAAFSELAEDEYLEYAYCGLGYPADFSDVTGKLALIKRGELTFVQKAQNAKAAGAVGVLIYNYEEDTVNMAALGMPAASLTLSEGTRLLNREDKRLRCNGSKVVKKENLDPALMSEYSSWGVCSTLELKPEISAPGGKIYSSVPDNKYKAMSGTSMASPYMAGIAALSRQYYAENPFAEEFNGKTGSEKTDLIENLAMNSASIVRQKNGVAYSPRVQGAGLVDMQGILKSRVLLTGDSGKAKLSLGDDLSDTLELAFDITNITEEDITFDKITVEVLTDGYTEGTEGCLVSDSVAVKAVTDKVPKSVTVPSGETVTFEAEVGLDAEFLEKNAEIFTNGFYIDGYVILENKEDSELKASLPFTGFYGDWGAESIFDSTVYDEGGSYLVDSTNTSVSGTFLAANYGESLIKLGKNLFFPNVLDEKYIAYSTNSGCVLSTIMTNFRAAKDFDALITDSEGNTITNDESSVVLPKFIPLYIGYAYAYDDISNLDEGQYNAVTKATVLGDTVRTDELSIPFTLDNTYPEILDADYDEAAKTVTVKAKENHYISAIYIAYPENSKIQYEYIQVFDEDYAADGSVTKVIDVSMISDISQAEIGCIDYALNQTYYDMDYFIDEIGAEILGSERLKTMTQAEFNVKNNTAENFSADFILAFYDEDDRLITTSIESVEIDAGAEEKLTYAFFENTQDAAYVKLLLWDYAQKMPMDKLKQFTLD